MRLNKIIGNKIREFKEKYEIKNLRYGGFNKQANKSLESIRNYNERHKIMKRSLGWQ